jgi:cell division inhibitor SepF
MVYLGLVDDDEYDYDYEYEEAAAPQRAAAPSHGPVVRPAGEMSSSGVRTVAPEDSGLPAPKRPSVVRTSPQVSPKVHLVEPTAFNDAQEVGDRLKVMQPVILNLQGLDRDLQRRLIDFASGLTYALGGTMSRVHEEVFLLAPANVEVSPEEKERLQARGLYAS